MISFDNERLHTANKERMRKQRKLISSHLTNQDTSEKDNTTASDTDNLSETSDEDNDGDSDDEDNDGDSDDETSDNNNDDTGDEKNDDSDDEENDDGPNQDAEDLYYNPKSRKWKNSDEDS